MKNCFVFLLIVLSSVLFAQNKFRQSGGASFYSDKYVGKTTSSGELYNPEKLTAAHLSIPYGSLVKVTNPANNKSVIVRINDRGPYFKGRIIDVSKRAARELGFSGKGVCQVSIEVISETILVAPKPLLYQEILDSIPRNPQYFLLKSEIYTPIGFGVQIGSFSDIDNILIRISNVDPKLRDKVIIQIAEQSGQKKYRVILGAFEKREEALNCKSSVEKDFPGCFVINF